MVDRNPYTVYTVYCHMVQNNVTPLLSFLNIRFFKHVSNYFPNYCFCPVFISDYIRPAVQ